MTHLSTHFTLNEMIVSGTATRLGIDNTPPPGVRKNLVRLAAQLEKVRTLTGKPLKILSGYRSPKVNKAVGGSPKSYHMQGCAADFDPPAGMTHDALQKAIGGAAAIAFDLVLEERAKDGAHWLHFQIPLPGKKGRRLLKDAELDKQGGAIKRLTPG